MTLHFIRYFLLVWAVFQIPGAIQAQNVSLVLSGGGAKGIAYIGAIRALEEHDIPIDYVIGTSMGGVVGAFYAAGYTPDEMEEIVTSPDFLKWLSGEYEEDYDFHIFNPDLDPALFNLQIKLKPSLSMDPQIGLIDDKSLNWELSELLDPAAAVAQYNFDSLMIPFRCIASELYSQQAVVVDSGSLSNAVRVTMGLPTIFPPYQMDDQYLFDGGIYSNFPSKEARNMYDAEYTIGINVGGLDSIQGYPYDNEEIFLSGVIWRLFMENTDTSGLGGQATYIEPDIGNATMADFDQAEFFIQAGYQAVIENIDKILNGIKRRETASERAQKRRDFKGQMPPWRIAKPQIKVLDKKSPLRRYSYRVFRFQNRAPTLENIKRNYFSLAQTDYYVEMQPNFVYDRQEEKYNFVLGLKPKKSLGVGIGGNLASRNISSIYLNLRYGFDLDWLHHYKLEVHLGPFHQQIGLGGRMYLPFSRVMYIEPGLRFSGRDYQQSNEFLNFLDDEISGLSQTDRDLFVHVGLELSPKTKTWLGITFFNSQDEFITSDSVSTQALNQPSRSTLQGRQIRWALGKENLNYPTFANRGFRWFLETTYVRAEEKYRPGAIDRSRGRDAQTFDHNWFQAQVQVEKYFDLKWYHPGLLVNAYYSNRPLFQHITSDLSNAMGFNPLPDSPTLFLEDFRSREFVALGLRNVISFSKSLDVRMEGYLFYNIDPLSARQNLSVERLGDPSSLRVGALSLVLHSIVGPISLTGTYYEGGAFQPDKWLILLNIGHLLLPERPRRR